jgi:hypothetical protein
MANQRLKVVRHIIASVFNIGALVIAVVISLFWAAAGLWALFLLFPAQMIAERVTGPLSRHAQSE